MGKSEDQIKKRVKDAPKSPISPIWFGTSALPSLVRKQHRLTLKPPVLLGFIVFGGLFFEVLSRIFTR
jgi:hypothetical protein